MFDVAIIGGGVIGGMLARQLSRYRLSVCLLEKENDVAVGATKANSGIVHGGYDPTPGTLKARLNVTGVERLYHVADELHASYRKNGSLICAFGTPAEEAAVRKLYERGLANGVRGLEILTGDEARALEPALSEQVSMVLHVTNAGIICPYELTVAAIGNAMDNGVALKVNFAVSTIRKTDKGFTVSTENGESVEAAYVVNCAGAYADRIAAMVGDDFFTVIPRAGEYMLLDKNEGARVSHTIFQVPGPSGKGVLVTPTVDGNLLIGPTAVRVEAPDCTETTQEGLDTVARLAAKSVPSVNVRHVITGFSGVRASEKGGDFIIEPARSVKGMLHVAGIDSPGLTACVAIADYAIELLRAMGLHTVEKADFNPYRESSYIFREMSDDEKDAYIKAHPAYGKIVCRCETVSEGEIRDAIRRNPPARDLDGVKRRTRSGMGRCQGGFCMPYVMRLIAEETGVPMERVTKKGEGSYQLLERL